MKQANQATSTSVELSQLLFVGTHGCVRALEKQTGQQVWNTDLPKGGMQLVTLLCEDGVLFAGVFGRVHALDAVTGRILWSNELPEMGYSFMTLATVRAAAHCEQLVAAAAASAAAATAAIH